MYFEAEAFLPWETQLLGHEIPGLQYMTEKNEPGPSSKAINAAKYPKLVHSESFPVSSGYFSTGEFNALKCQTIHNTGYHGNERYLFCYHLLRRRIDGTVYEGAVAAGVEVLKTKKAYSFYKTTTTIAFLFLSPAHSQP